MAQLRTFIDLPPDWDEVAVGLNAIVIDAWEWNTMGWHTPGVVAICAWEPELWWTHTGPRFIEEHSDLLELLGVERAEGEEAIELRWTEEQARAFQLLHVLPHELGHHRDRMTTRSQRDIARGEPYAERYANQVLEKIYRRYVEQFAL